jgi:hypothetical protein
MRDPMKIHHDAREAIAEAVQAESRLRRILPKQSIVLNADARQAARKCLDALDRFDALIAKARELGVEP